MSMQQQPRVGSWYVNMTGKLMKVRALVYHFGRLTGVSIEYLDGSRHLADITSWNCLDLTVHGVGVSEASQRRRTMENETNVD